MTIFAARREEELETRVTTLLRGLVSIDTSNPPGRETVAARYLQGYLESCGIEAELVARDPDRANLVARIRGRSDGPTFAFLGHLDVVPANPKPWSVDPFAGELRDGQIWGRGTVDMKCWVAAACVAAGELVRDGGPPGDVLLIFAADEEDGSAGVGAPWLLEERPDLAPDFLVGEGAGERFEVGGTPFYGMAPVEKTFAPTTVRVIAKGGDASSPRQPGNTLVEVAPLIERLTTYRAPLRPEPEPELLLDAIGAPDGELSERVEWAKRSHPLLEQVLEPMLTTTMAPTALEASGKSNQLACEAELTVSCQSLPGVEKGEIEEQFRDALADANAEIEVSEPNGGSRSPLGTPLHALIADVVAAEEPGARVVPTIGLGYTDSHLFRERHGTVAYGFIPFRYQEPLTSLRTKHGTDERVDVRDLLLQTRVALELARRIGAEA